MNTPNTTPTHAPRRLWPVLWALCLLATPVAADDGAAVLATLRAFHQALRVGDAATVQRLLAPDAVVLEAGHRETRAEYLRHHLQADMDFARGSLTEPLHPLVTVVGDVAWASAESRTTAAAGKPPLHLAGAELVVLARGAQGWLIRAIHWSSRTLR